MLLIAQVELLKKIVSLKMMYKVYELYNYSVTYFVEAESKTEALDMVIDNPSEYRDYELDDDEHTLMYRIAEKVVDNGNQ
jgi:hypothetical protein